MRILAPSTILFLLLCVVQSKAGEPRRDTLRAWDDYIGAVNTTVEERNVGTKPFLSIDESSDARRRVQKGS